jgi:hypothetical protein
MREEEGAGGGESPGELFGVTPVSAVDVAVRLAWERWGKESIHDPYLPLLFLKCHTGA